MDWTELFGAIGVPTILNTLILFGVTRHYNKKDKNEGLSNKVEELNNKYKEDSEALEKTIKEINNVLEILTNAQQAVLRDRIIHMYNTYFLGKKYMPIYARESLDHMYKEYKNLNGNGVVEGLVERMYWLPTEPEKSDSE